MRRIFRKQGVYENLEKKIIVKQIELVMIIDNFVVEDIFNRKEDIIFGIILRKNRYSGENLIGNDELFY